MKQVVVSLSGMAKSITRAMRCQTAPWCGGNKLYPYIPLSTRAERKKQLIEQKVAFEKGKPKHRYVGIYAPNRRIKRAILQALRWQTFPYPKRKVTPSKASGLDAGSSLAAPVGSASDATLPSLTRPRSVLWGQGGIDGRTRAARIEAGRSRKTMAMKNR